MALVKLKDVVMRVKDKVDRDTADLDFYIGGEHFDYAEICISRRGVIQGSTIGPAFHMRFQPGDVLLMSRNPHLRKAGVVDFEGICSDVSYVCRTKDESVLLQRYLPFIFQTDHFWDFAESNKKGSTNFFLNWSDFEKYEFNLPPIEIQRELTELLWAAENTKLAYIDLLRQTDELVKSQFIEMFGGDKYPRKRLADVALVSSGLTKNSKRASLPLKMKYLRVANVLFNELDLSDVQEIGVEEREIEKTLLEKNDLLFVEGNGSPEQIGRVSLWDGSITPMLHQNHIIKARFAGEVIPLYAMYYFMSDEGRKQILLSASTTSGLYTLSAGKIAAFELPEAPLNRQEEFIAVAQQSDKSKFELKQHIDAIDGVIRTLSQIIVS